MSPANILGSQFDEQFERSFMQDKNKSAPRMVPAPLPLGTPQVSIRLSVKGPLTEHCLVQFSKYDSNHFNQFPDIP